MEAPTAVAHPSLGQVPDSHPQRSLLICHASVPVAGPRQGQHLAGPALAHAVGCLQVLCPARSWAGLRALF